MKKILLPLIVCVLFAFTGHTQDLQIIYQGSTIVNGDSLFASGNPTANDIYQNLWVLNNSGQSLTVKVTRKEMNVTTGTLNATCWDICPPADTAGFYPTLTSNTSIIMADSAYEYSFSAHLYPEGISGCSHFRYIFFGQSTSIMDSVDIFFSHGQSCATVASVQNTYEPTSFNIFPNPAKDNITISLAKNIPDGELIVTNILGIIVARKSTASLDTNPTLSVAELDNGFYFLSVVSDDNVLHTQKFQVAR